MMMIIGCGRRECMRSLTGVSGQIFNGSYKPTMSGNFIVMITAGTFHRPAHPGAYPLCERTSTLLSRYQRIRQAWILVKRKGWVAS
jgi:hypothetical protein